MKYTVKRLGRSVELSEANSSVLVYRIPFQNLSSDAQEPIKIKNKFIVYILFKENPAGKDVVYVGKSKNGLKNRPRSHGGGWQYCYILTQFEERTFFNDGTIQYIEDKVSKRINELNHYENTTQITTAGTANRNDEEDCDDYLERAYQMLDVLGLDLITHCQDTDQGDINEVPEGDSNTVVQDGIYYLSWKLKRWNGKTAKGKMRVAGGKYIVLKGSDVCPNEGHGLFDAIRIKRMNASIVNDKLQEDVIISSPSGAAEFITGGAANGWLVWKNEEGQPIDIFRTPES